MDLVQLRWMQIRSFEMQQATERENVELRKELIDLRSFASANSGMHKVALGTLSRNLFEWLRRLKAEVNALKSSFLAEIEKSKITSSLFADMFKKLLANQSAMLKENEKLKRTNTDLTNELDKGRKEAVSAIGIKNQEVDRLKAKILKLQEELGNHDSMNSNWKAEIDRLKEELEASQKEKSALSSKYEASNSECKKLRALISKLEAEFAASEMNFRNEHEMNLSTYRLTTNEMMEQMNKLRAVIIEQQAEIERLTKALSGNKSHFAKFVELKEENVALASKLKSALGEIPSYDPIGGVFVGKGTSAAIQPNAGGSRPSAKTFQKSSTRRFSDLASSIPDPSLDPNPSKVGAVAAASKKVGKEPDVGLSYPPTEPPAPGVKSLDGISSSKDGAIPADSDARVRELLFNKYGLDLSAKKTTYGSSNADDRSTPRGSSRRDSGEMQGNISRPNSSRRNSSTGRCLSSNSLQYIYTDEDVNEDAAVGDGPGVVISTDAGVYSQNSSIVMMAPTPPKRDAQGNGAPYRRERKSPKETKSGKGIAISSPMSPNQDYKGESVSPTLTKTASFSKPKPQSFDLKVDHNSGSQLGRPNSGNLATNSARTKSGRSQQLTSTSAQSTSRPTVNSIKPSQPALARSLQGENVFPPIIAQGTNATANSKIVQI